MQPRSIKVYDLTTFTLLDYPDTPAAIIWLAGCNMRCPYCHNRDVVFGQNELDFKEVLAFLHKRKNLLEGVVISGGEPTIHKDIVSICEKIKELGYKIKLDTNGSKPEVLKRLLQRDLLDYVAIDFKAPQSKYKNITNLDAYSQMIESIKLVQQASIKYEIRTTVHTDLLNEDDIGEIIDTLKSIDFSRTYYIQNFIDRGKTIERLPDQKQKLNTSFIQEDLHISFRNF